MGKRRSTEVIEVGHLPTEVQLIIRHAVERASRGDLSGLVVVFELPRGAYEAKVTSTDNLAERLGRLDLLCDDMKDGAEEE